MWFVSGQKGSKNVPDKECTRQRMVLGTHTAGGEPNSLLVAEALLPKDDSEMDLKQINEDLTDDEALHHVAERVNTIQMIPHDGEVNRARLDTMSSQIQLKFVSMSHRIKLSNTQAS